ncbi:MAG: glucokinase [Gammaproteobacteria bacterium]|nr:glucokinase [Gammaproteobacteria bacterium]
MADLCLVADIGATNVRFALVEPGGVPEHPRAMAITDYPGIGPAAHAYLQQHAGPRRPRYGAFAVAAPVDGDRVRMTNIEREFSIAQLARELGLERLFVCNDFLAAALAVPRLGDGDAQDIGPVLPAKPGVVAVLGPGTGLGVATLVAHDGGWLALDGEGGHVTVAAQTPQEWAVVERLGRRFGHVSAERMLSGPGLLNIYTALGPPAGDTPATPAALVDAARAGAPRARAALELFFAMLGSVAGDLALTVGARGGVYLAGGILPRVIDLLRDSPFRARFEAKGRFGDYLRRIPTRLVTTPNPALAGLSLFLEQQLGSHP